MWMFSIICQLQHDWSILLVIVISWHAAPHCLSLVLFSSHCRLWNRCRRLYVLHIYVHAFMHVRLYVSTISPLSSICWWVFAKLLSLVHLGTEVNWLGFEVKRSKVKVTLSQWRRPALVCRHSGFYYYYYSSVLLWSVECNDDVVCLLASIVLHFVICSLHDCVWQIVRNRYGEVLSSVFKLAFTDTLVTCCRGAKSVVGVSRVRSWSRTCAVKQFRQRAYERPSRSLPRHPSSHRQRQRSAVDLLQLTPSNQTSSCFTTR